MFGFFKKKPKDPPPPPPAPVMRVNPVPATGDQKFALSLYPLLAGKPGNAFFSPYSIAAALAMVQAGASGKAREEIETALGHPGAGDRLIEAAGSLARELAGRSEPTPFEKRRLEEAAGAPSDTFGCHLSWANALWHQKGYPIRPEFVESLKSRLGADVSAADFAGAPEESRAAVNAWAAKATRDKIREVLAPGVISALTRVILANAIYFKARWDDPFSESSTEPGPFTLLDGSKVQVPLMRKGGHLKSSRDGDLQALELAYTGGKISMILVLPDAGKFEQEQKSLTAERLEGMVRAMEGCETHLSLPKFRIESSFLLRSALESLGIGAAFGTGADFTRVSSEPGFGLSEMIHKTYVDVNEQGTEAAAVTLSMLAGCAPPKRIVQFHCDRPFLFVIRDLPTGTPLFMGRVADPR
jgi:serpin B